MSFKKNVLVSYVSQIYSTLIGILFVPVYIGYMGTEAYGLVGFYAMLQAWFQLLDMGLTSILSRETARHGGGAVDASTLRGLLRALEIVFCSLAAIGALVLLVGADTIALRWLKVERLPLEQVRVAIQLMAGIIGLRWIAGLYRGAIGGFEQQVWLGKLDIATATTRFVLVLLIFETLGTTPIHFFAYQLMVACIDTGLLAFKTYRLIPAAPSGERTPWSLAPLRGVMKFSLSIAFTSSVWVFVTQTDKLILSKMLHLSDYAYFTLAVLVASGVSIMSSPVSSALMPRLSRHNAEGDDVGLLQLYRHATQLVAVIMAPLALMLAFFAYPLLLAWSGNAETAAQAAPILRLYALGNGVLGLAAFPYYLQFAKGDVRLHMLGNILFIVILLPTLVVVTYWYGAIGAGWTWLLLNVTYLAVWTPLVHRRMVPGLHWCWLLTDIAPSVFVAAMSSYLAAELLRIPESRIAAVITLFLIGLTVMLLTALLSKLGWTAIRRYFDVKRIVKNW